MEAISTSLPPTRAEFSLPLSFPLVNHISNNTINLIGWILFIISAIGFIISSIGSFWAMFSSVFFLFTGLVFLIPFFRKNRN